ncbi:MAG: hypothetical protein H7246_21120, partial [Phycisphaerae bacterium]|nr:hypothetical protein [Saprospiraceae bacterium]
MALVILVSFSFYQASWSQSSTLLIDYFIDGSCGPDSGCDGYITGDADYTYQCGDVYPGSFSDPVPSGIVTTISVDYYAACEGGTFELSLNGTILQTIVHGDPFTTCSCDCPTPLLNFSVTNGAGIPGYIYGGNNTLDITRTAGSGFHCAWFSNVTLEYSEPLPVELVAFNAGMHKDKAVLLNWRTASESNNEGFHIDHSPDGRSWQTRGFVPGHGNSQTEQVYQFLDERPLPGTNYYRLKQIDFNGQFEYSAIKSVLVAGDRKLAIQVYPNP